MSLHSDFPLKWIMRSVLFQHGSKSADPWYMGNGVLGAFCPLSPGPMVPRGRGLPHPYPPPPGRLARLFASWKYSARPTTACDPTYDSLQAVQECSEQAFKRFPQCSEHAFKQY